METVQDQIAQAPTAARAAALWWAQQVGAPIFRNTGERDSAQDRINGDMAGMMALLVASNHPVDDTQGAKFADELERRIGGILERTTYGVSLSVDYGPDPELAEAARAAGISTSRFPWKTHMRVKPDHVTAALGYGSPDRLIWTAPDWVHPVCAMQRYDEIREGRQVVDYVARDEVCGRLMYHDGDHGDYQPDTKRCKGCSKTYSEHHRENKGNDRTHSWEPAR